MRNKVVTAKYAEELKQDGVSQEHIDTYIQESEKNATSEEAGVPFGEQALNQMNDMQLRAVMMKLGIKYSFEQLSTVEQRKNYLKNLSEIKQVSQMRSTIEQQQTELGFGEGETLRDEGEGGRIEGSKFDQNDSIDYDSSTISTKDKLLKYAKVDQRKFSEYIFKEGSAPGKEVVFNKLGYTKKQSLLLGEIYKEQGNAKFQSGAYRLGKLDRFGQRTTIVIELHGIGENTNQVVHVISGWMIRSDGTITLNTPFAGFEK